LMVRMDFTVWGVLRLRGDRIVIALCTTCGPYLLLNQPARLALKRVSAREVCEKC